MNLVRRLSLVALALGIAAPFAGTPYRPRHGRIDIDNLADIVKRGDDHVDALQLAQWIRDRKPGLRVIDLRSADEFEGYAIPTAQNMAIDAVARAGIAPTELVVLYSGNGVHAGQAWVFLHSLGVRNVVFLRGGMGEWQDEVLNPVLAPDATPQAKRDFERASALSLYFGGVPRLADAGSPNTQEAHAARRQRRRGC